MSIGLGKTEKHILKALKKCGVLSLDELATTRRYGCDFWVNEDKLDALEGGVIEGFDRDSAVWQSTARAVRSLARKGLITTTRISDDQREDRRKVTKVVIC